MIDNDEYIKNIKYLSNEKLIDDLEYCGHDGYYNVFYYPIIKEIKRRLPSNGKWIIHGNDLFPTESTQECSICHHEQKIYYGNDDNFCPNCGAHMENDNE